MDSPKQQRIEEENRKTPKVIDAKFMECLRKNILFRQGKQNIYGTGTYPWQDCQSDY